MPLILGGHEIHGGFADQLIDGRNVMVNGAIAIPLEPAITHRRTWWDPGEWGTRLRGDHKIRCLDGHWTAGEAGTRLTSDDGPVVVGNMKRRPSLKRPGWRLQVGVPFVIGAADPDTGEAMIWQTADPLLTVSVHLGSALLNNPSIGVEVVNKGAPPALKERPRKTIRLPVAGIPGLRQLAFQPGQLRAWIRLADLLQSRPELAIARRVPAQRRSDGSLEVRSMRFTRAQARTWSGAREHYLAYNTHKLDAGSQLLRALLDPAAHGVDDVAPWELVLPS